MPSDRLPKDLPENPPSRLAENEGRLIADAQDFSGTPPSEAKRQGWRGDLFGSFALSYFIAIGLLGLLVYFGGVWDLIANTRLLDLLIQGGIIKYHDGHQGVVDGVADLGYYLKSQDPIDWRLVTLAFGLYFLWFGAKACQFHGIARFVGMKGYLGQHARAWLFGNTMDRVMPYQIGHAATTASLQGQGENPQLAAKAFGVANVLVIVFEIFLFVIWGVLMITWSLWFAQIFWALMLFAVGWMFLRGGRPSQMLATIKSFWSDFGVTLRALMNRPSTFLWLGFLGAFSMLLDDIAPFVIAKAFTGDHVIINVPFIYVQAAVVSGYIAKQAPITPHGLGQFEWAFAASLYMSGLGFPDAATLAILDSVVRNTAALMIMGIVNLWYGIETGFPGVLGVFARPQPDLAVN